MDWNAIGAIAELVSGLGVILTLAFVALQIRHNSQAVQNETLAALNATMTANIMVFAQSSELSKILRSGLANFDSLSQVDKFRFQLGISTTLRNYETAFSSWRAGMLEKQAWRGMEATLLQFFESEGVRNYWAANSHTYNEAFRAHLQSFCESHGTVADAETAEQAAPQIAAAPARASCSPRRSGMRRRLVEPSPAGS